MILGIARAKTHHERVKAAIELTESVLQRETEGFRREALFDLLSISAVLILILLAAVFSNLAGLLTAIGLGGLGARVQWKAWKDSMRSYITKNPKKMQPIEARLDKIKGEFNLCSENDDENLRKIEDMLRELWDALSRVGAEEK